MIELIVIYLILIVLGIAISFILNRKFEEGMPMAVLSIVIILYIFGIFEALEYGVYFLYILASFALLWCIYYVIKNKPNLSKQIFTPGFLIYFVLFGLIWWMHRGRVVYNTDALNQWALSVKNMMIFNKIPTKIESSIVTASYPPGISLFQYFWMKTYGYFGEGNLFRALNIFGCTMLLPVIKNFSWRKWYYSFWVFLLMFLGIFAFSSSFFTNLQVDPTVGLILALVLILYFNRNWGLYELLMICFGLAVITLLKYTTITVAVIVVGIMYIDLLFLRKKHSAQIIHKNKYLRWIIVILPVVLICLTFISWEVFYKMNNIRTSSQIVVATQRININIIGSFFKSLSSAMVKVFTITESEKIIFFGKTIFFQLLFALTGIILLKKIRYIKKYDAYDLFLIFIGWIMYIFGRIAIYIFAHSQSVIESAQGFERYLSLFNVTVIIYIIHIFVKYIEKERNIQIYFLDQSKSNSIVIKEVDKINFTPNINFKVFFIIVITFIFIFISNFKDMTSVIFNPKDSMQASYNYSLTYYCTNRISDSVNYEKDIVYFIASDYSYGSGNDYAYYRARYNNVPMKLSESRTFPKGGSNIYPWTLGPPRKNWGDDTNVYYTIDEWQEILYKGFTYVYIFAADERFIEDYGQLFESSDKIERDTLFFIDKTDNGKVSLIKVN